MLAKSIYKSLSTIAVLALLIAASAFVYPQNSNRKIIYGPYVQNVTATRAVICWVEAEAEARIGVAPDKLEAAARDYRRHEMALDGLKPSTQYYYDVLKDGTSRGTGRFTTAPQGSAPFMFVVYGDTRTRPEIHRQIVQRIIPLNPSLVLHTGDLVARGRRAVDWDGFFDVVNEMVRNVPLFPSLGNHEDDSPLYYQFFALPGSERYYSFDWGGVHFIALDSNDPRPEGDARGTTAEAKAAYEKQKEEYWKAQTRWLEQDLKANRSADFICVYFHHPPFSTRTSRAASAARMRNLFVKIFEIYKVDIVFNGHDHNYQRHISNGIHYVVTGGGGAPLYDTEQPLPGITQKLAQIEHFLKVNVAEQKMEIEAIDLKGNLIEKFEVAKRQRSTAGP